MKYGLAILVFVFALFTVDTLRTYLLIKKSATLVQSAIPFSRSKPDAPLRILVLGDSTAVGTGAVRNEESTAGRLGTLYKDAEVVNLAQNGQRLEGLLHVLSAFKDTQGFDIVLIQIGANDIIRMTSLKDIQKRVQAVLEHSRSFGGQVVILHSGDIGEATFFPIYARPLLTYRSKKVREIYIEEAEKNEASYVDLMNSQVEKLLKEKPSLYYASDRLHLSGEGYGLWFNEIQKQLKP